MSAEAVEHIFPLFLSNYRICSYIFCNFSQQRSHPQNCDHGAAFGGIPDHGHIPCSSSGGDITIGLLVETAGRARVGRHDGDPSQQYAAPEEHIA